MGKALSPFLSPWKACRGLVGKLCILLTLLLPGAPLSLSGADHSSASASPPKTTVPEPASRWLLLDAARNGNLVFSVGERGVILRSEDSGRTWLRCEAPSGDTLTGICFSADGKQGWAVGHGPRLLSTSDGGLSWKNNYTHSGSETSLLDVASVAPSHIIAVGAFGFALESRDAGQSWRPLNLPSADRHLNRIQYSLRGEIYIAGESGLLLRSQDQGDTWQALPSPYEGSYYGVLPLSSGVLLAHGLRGTLLRAASGNTESNSGNLPSWDRLHTPQSGLLATALQTSRGLVLVAGQARVYLISRDDGATFTAWNPGITSAVAELIEAPDGGILAFGEEGISRLPAP